MEPLELILSCTEPVPRPVGNQAGYGAGWSIRTADGRPVAEGVVPCAQWEDEVRLWLALTFARDWLDALRLPVSRLVVEHFDLGVRETLGWGKAAPAVVRKGKALYLIEFLNALPYPWEVAEVVSA